MAAMEVVTNSMYLGHFALQGAMGGLASQAIGFLNGILSYRRDDPLCKALHRMLPVAISVGLAWDRAGPCAVLCAVLLTPRPSPATQVALLPLGAFVYEGPPDLLPLLATLIRLLSFMSSSMLHTRLLQVSASASLCPPPSPSRALALSPSRPLALSPSPSPSHSRPRPHPAGALLVCLALVRRPHRLVLGEAPQWLPNDCPTAP
jgi:hypothetical protein